MIILTRWIESMTNTQRSIGNDAAGVRGLVLLEPIVPLSGRHQNMLHRGSFFLEKLVLACPILRLAASQNEIVRTSITFS